VTNFKKQFFLIFFILAAGFFAVGSASAQTWNAWSSAGSSAENACITNLTSPPVGTVGQCHCNQGFTYGIAHFANCTMSGFVAGCWNPGSGKCNTCGSGGTVVLGSLGCFSGQSNDGGTNPGIHGVSCTVSQAGTYASTQCLGAGTSGGQSTN